ncbi:hypothetical protein [Paenibacillus tuaregi]|uniref:hypothetical protein n=1 Tax=Paenibacillus tuaregi TaxID=1816681 RepID=UPI000837EB02|nr:hypothetical protein [Paenibacillus tuaregi]
MSNKHVSSITKACLAVGLSAAVTVGAAGASLVSVNPASAAGSKTAVRVSPTDVYQTFESYVKKSSKLAQARQYLIKNIGKVSPARATTMVLHLENAQKAQLESVSEKFYPSNVQKVLDSAYRKKKDLSYTALLGQIKDSKTRKLLAEARDKGYKVGTGEGMYFLTMDYAGFKQFGRHVTKDIAAYIDIMAEETNKPALSDAAVVISWSELIKRGLAMESFVSKYPGSNRAKAVALAYNGIKFNIFYGSSNTPVYKENSKNEYTTLKPEIRKAYEAAVKQGTKNSKLLASIGHVLEMLKKSDELWTKELDRYLKKQVGE